MSDIGLIELLLLGAPDGKTERIDGRVLRRFVGGSEDEARATYEAVRADIKEMFGTVSDAGDDACSLGVVHLRRTGERVEIEVEVSLEVFRAF